MIGRIPKVKITFYLEYSSKFFYLFLIVCLLKVFLPSFCFIFCGLADLPTNIIFSLNSFLFLHVILFYHSFPFYLLFLPFAFFIFLYCFLHIILCFCFLEDDDNYHSRRHFAGVPDEIPKGDDQIMPI